MVQAFASVGLAPQSVLNLQGPPPPAAPAAAAAAPAAAPDAFQAQAPQAQAPQGAGAPQADGLLRNIGKVIEQLGALLKSIGELFQGLGGGGAPGADAGQVGGAPQPGGPPQAGDAPGAPAPNPGGGAPPPVGGPAPAPAPAPGGNASPVKDFMEKELPAKLAANPQLVRDINAPFQVNITGPQGGSWGVDLTKKSDWVHAGAQGNPKMTITVSDSDFAKIRNKELDPTAAVMQGKLKFEPFDMGLAQKIGDLLK